MVKTKQKKVEVGSQNLDICSPFSVLYLFLVLPFIFLTGSPASASHDASRGSRMVVAAEVSQDNWGAPKVQVFQKQEEWIIKGLKNRIVLNTSDLQMTVSAEDQTWSSGRAAVHGRGDTESAVEA